MKLIKTIKHYLTLWRYRRAVKEANRLHKATRKRYYVLRLLGRYHVVNRQQIRELKRNGTFKRDLNIKTLIEVAAYWTR